ncbi:transcription factor DIVARICATA-like protein [Tanacetum coccineum]
MYDQEQEQTNDESTQLVPTWTDEDLLQLQSALMMDDTWTKEDELLFQSALVMVPVDMEGRWEKIAERVPGKTAEDVSAYYEALVCEVIEIESGRVELPSYADDVNDEEDDDVNVVVKKKRGRKSVASLGGEPRTSQKNEKRKKGSPWSEEEHR